MVLAALRKIFGKSARKPARPATRRLNLESLEARWVPSSNITVNPGGSIEAAIVSLENAHSGGTVTVNPGTYTENLSFNSAGSNIKLVASSGNDGDCDGDDGSNQQVIIKSPTTNAASALILLNGATNVGISGFTINGSNAPGNVYWDIFVGGGGSVNIKNNTITGPNDANNPLYGVGIQIGLSQQFASVSPTGGATTGTAKISGNTISNYLAPGIVIDNTHSAVTVTNNTIQGLGTSPAATTVQYGVQVSDGAAARISGNSISNNSLDLQATQGVASAGIFVINSSANTAITNNCINSNDTGVLLQIASNVQVINNDVTNSGANGGITLVQGSTYNTIENNYLNGGLVDGIGLFGASNYNCISNNCVTRAGNDGVYIEYSTGNNVEGNDLECNAFNGIWLNNAVNTGLFFNDTSGNAMNGILITGGSCNTIVFDGSIANNMNGIMISGASNTLIEASTIALNGGYGIYVLNSANTTIEYNIIVFNDNSGIQVVGSTNTCTIGNVVFGNNTSTKEAWGASAVTCSSQNSCSHADSMCSGIDDF